MKILLSVDGSAYTKRMLGYVAAHDEVFGAAHEYTALTVVPAVPPHLRAYIDAATIESNYLAQANEVLSPVLRFAQQKGWNLTAQHVVGNAGDAIAEMATASKYELIVMGSRGHSALANVLLGSVTSRVLAQCDTPVLIVR